MEIIDSAVLDNFYRNEEVRKVAGKGAWAAYWETMIAKEPEKVSAFSRVKNLLIGKRPE